MEANIFSRVANLTKSLETAVHEVPARETMKLVQVDEEPTYCELQLLYLVPLLNIPVIIVRLKSPLNFVSRINECRSRPRRREDPPIRVICAAGQDNCSGPSSKIGTTVPRLC